jgi:prepilin peptidase CpaA
MSGLEITLLCLVLQAAASDLAWRRIPNVLVLAGLLLALLLHWRLGGGGALLAQGLAGAGVGLLLFLPLYAPATSSWRPWPAVLSVPGRPCSFPC